MELHERVSLVIKKTSKSRSNLAQELNIKQTTFNSWFCRGRQDCLWPYLARILELYPHISREWLFFDEGSVLKSETGGLGASQVREKELLLKIEQLSGLLIKLENQLAAQ